MEKIKIGNKRLKIKVCADSLSQAIGLMFSRQKNILFKFDKEDLHSIHMLFVFYPLDIVWINKNKVVDVKKAYPFISYLIPKTKAKYVLETSLNSGIKIGDKFSWK
ncbi:MAG: DUF192 domain-containing protein [Candidatus Woesearchaeota archaeon]|nr:MAG: DUF192 domain-containing protein [Candidatus Woesearchaeota archaeon]